MTHCSFDQSGNQLVSGTCEPLLTLRPLVSLSAWRTIFTVAALFDRKSPSFRSVSGLLLRFRIAMPNGAAPGDEIPSFINVTFLEDAAPNRDAGRQADFLFLFAAHPAQAKHAAVVFELGRHIVEAEPKIGRA